MRLLYSLLYILFCFSSLQSKTLDVITGHQRDVIYSSEQDYIDKYSKANAVSSFETPDDCAYYMGGNAADYDYGTVFSYRENIGAVLYNVPSGYDTLRYVNFHVVPNCPLICPAGQIEENNVCVVPIPTCADNQILNDTNTSCVYPTLLSVTAGDPNEPETADNHIYNYSNGTTQICSASSSTCSTFTKTGVNVGNIPIDGVIYNTVDNMQNFRFLQLGASTIGLVAGVATVIGTAGLATPAFTATAGTSYVAGGIGLTIASQLGSTPYISNDPINNNTLSSATGIKINLADYDFNTPSSSVTNTTDANGNKVSTTTAQDGSTQAITFTPTDIVSTTTSTDGTTQTVSIPNAVLTTPTTTNDFSNTNNIPNVDYTVTTTIPTRTNNDGTVTSSSTEVVSKTLSSSDNVSTTSSTVYTTAPVTSSSAVATSSASDSSSTSNTTSSDGTTTSTTQNTTSDLSSITRRLDQMINQNTVSNNKLDDLNKEETQKKILDSIKDLIEKQPSKDDIQDAFTQALNDQNNTKLTKEDLSDAFLDALNRHDANSTTPGDSNTTTPDDSNTTGDTNTTDPGTSTGDYNTTVAENNVTVPNPDDYNATMSSTIEDVKNAIANQYGQTFNIFDGSSACGSGNFAPSVLVMGTELKNPLKVADDAMNDAGVYVIIKSLFLFAATFLGLMSLFRR